MKFIRKDKKNFFWNIFALLKIKKNKIIFNQFNGLGYGDNPKYICEEILKQGLDYKLVWLVRDEKIQVPVGIKKVKIDSIRAIYHLSTAKVWISNVRIPFYTKKRKSQKYIQTWHGGLGLKKVEKDVEEFLSKKYIESAKRDSQMADLFISNCKYRSSLYKRSFWYNGEILEVGTPRNDFIINNLNNYEYKNIIRKKNNIDVDKKIILYAPTYRNKNDMDVYKFDFMEIIKSLEEKFSEEYIFIIKLHPNISNKSNFIKYNNKILNFSNYSDMQELLLITDVLITDYSSCMFDYLLTRGKIFLLTKDLDMYTKEKGLNLDYYTLPFPIAQSNEELLNNIHSFDTALYEKNIEKFLLKVGMNETGKSGKEIVKRIEEWKNEKI